MPRPGTQALVVSRADNIVISALFASLLVRNNICTRGRAISYTNCESPTKSTDQEGMSYRSLRLLLRLHWTLFSFQSAPYKIFSSKSKIVFDPLKWLLDGKCRKMRTKIKLNNDKSFSSCVPLAIGYSTISS